MSKKINPNIFRLGKTKTWASQYFEKKSAEASIYDFKTLEIKKFIYKFFKNNGLLVHDCKIHYSNENFLHIFVSYYLTINAVKIIQTISNKQNITLRKKKFFEDKTFIDDFSKASAYSKHNKHNKHNKFYEHKKNVVNKDDEHNKFYEHKRNVVNRINEHNKFYEPKVNVISRYVNFYDNICYFKNYFHIKNSFYKSHSYYRRNKFILNKLSTYNLKTKKIARKILKPTRINNFKDQNTTNLKNFFEALTKKYYLALIKKYKQLLKKPLKANKPKSLIIKKYKQILKKALKTKRLKFLTIYKKYLAFKKYKTIKAIKNKTFLSKLFESLHLFINKKTNIRLTVCQLNKKLKSSFNLAKIKHLSKKLGSLRKFKQNAFFKEGVNIMFNSTLQTNSADLIGGFIATQLQKLKKHNFFLNFIKTTFLVFVNSNFSNLKGIKVIIKGRLNSRPRAKHRTINVGKGIPNLTINSKIDYSEKTAYTSNGTLGVKIWIYKK